jgi:hypothetical protein
LLEENPKTMIYGGNDGSQNSKVALSVKCSDILLALALLSGRHGSQIFKTNSADL